ncbi:penicillin acylase family protein [soil metagenome]
MIRTLLFAFTFLSLVSCQSTSDPSLPGLQEPVEIIRDTYGVNHIYAKNEHDLFYTQGYAAAKDRTFQFEIWRRQATGTVAEILGPRELKRDIGARLFKFRGDLKKEFNHYHPNGEVIINSFTEGINAYVTETEKNPDLLPIEFKLLGIKPQKWTSDIVISRHQGLLGNLSKEITLARAITVVGVDKVKETEVFEPGDPDLTIDLKIKKELLLDSIVELYDAFRKPLRFAPSDLIAQANPNNDQYQLLRADDETDYSAVTSIERQIIGSNNWIVSGSLTQSGSPILANDPHRAISAPSLRYMVHLNAPGWNVVGGGEPTIPGISIGHNEYGAWGLTVFAIDGEDLYVYDLNPKNPNQYKYQGGWEDMRSIQDTIIVKGGPDEFVEHKFTRHGPVTFIDKKNNVAYAVRCAWMEPGSAPYMASLRIDQAKTWEEFREGCSFSNIPGENMIWADKKGNIGWQAVGIAPIRKNWSGLVPVPGDGTYEWDSYLPITSLPNVFNPSKGFWATANENLIPENYDHRNAVGWNWADPFRANRLNEALGNGQKHSFEEMMKLQFDYLSLPARSLVPLLKNISSKDASAEEARKILLDWNYVMDKNSVAAGVYMAWEKKISSAMLLKVVPEQGKKYIKSIPLSKVVHWTVSAGSVFGKNATAERDKFLLTNLEQAVNDLETKIGVDKTKWQYGQPSYHHALIKHIMSNAVNNDTRKKLDFGPLPRGGSASTPGVTGNTNNQSQGASFRMVADVSDWDKVMFTNTPGQSGDPSSGFYGNLFELWATDTHFPVYFSRQKVEQSAKEKKVFKP